MKKVLIIGAALFVAYSLFGKSKTDTSDNPILPNDTITPTTNYEGQIVIAPNGNWLYITNGLSYYVSQEALDSYTGPTAINVTQDVVDSFPISGHVGANLVTTKL